MQHTIIINGEEYNEDEAIAYATANWPFHVSDPNISDAIFILRSTGRQCQIIPPLCTIGIDNGLDGGVAVLSQSHGAIIAKCVMPTREVNGKREVDVVALKAWLLEVLDHDLTRHHFVVEMPVGSKSLNAAKSMAASFFGLVKFLESHDCIVTRIPARKWQKALLCCQGDTKAEALDAARKLWPDENWLKSPRCKIPHDGMVDGALIAEFTRTRQ